MDPYICDDDDDAGDNSYMYDDNDNVDEGK